MDNIVFKHGPFPASFSFRLFDTVDTELNFADEFIRTADLWYRKRPLCQLSHNHCPRQLCYSNNCKIWYYCSNFELKLPFHELPTRSILIRFDRKYFSFSSVMSLINRLNVSNLILFRLEKLIATR